MVEKVLNLLLSSLNNSTLRNISFHLYLFVVLSIIDIILLLHWLLLLVITVVAIVIYGLKSSSYNYHVPFFHAALASEKNFLAGRKVF